MKASIVLATYKEKENIVKLIKSILESCKKEKINCEIIVVDDNSPDGTADAVRKAYGKNKSVKLIVRTNEKGLGTAVGRGVKESIGDVVVFMDSDFSHDPKEIPKLIKLIKKYDIVNGSRHIKGGGMQSTGLRKIASKAARIAGTLYIGLVLGVKLTDYTNGYFVVRKSILNKLNQKKIFHGYGDYYFRLFYHAKKKGATIREIPVHYKFREEGESKTNFLKHGMQYALAGLKLRFE